MQNGPKIVPSSHRGKSARPYDNRSKQWKSHIARPNSTRDFQKNAQRSYERYLALAQAEVQSGNEIAAENYYQHAEHYFRSMSSDRETT